MTGGEFRQVLLRERVLAALKAYRPNNVLRADEVGRGIGISKVRAKRALDELVQLEYVDELDGGRYTISDKGYEHALDLSDFK